MGKLEKKKGNIGNCQTCGTQIFCNEVPAKNNYPARLQWQNRDNKAHYNTKDGIGFTCNIPPTIIENPYNIVSMYQDAKPKELDLDDLAVKALKKKCDIDLDDFDMMETLIYNRYGKNINPAKVGMMIKFLEERRLRQRERNEL